MNTSASGAAERLSRARGYPYTIPDASYLIDANGWRALADGDWLGLAENRHAVLALGSNRSPEQLARKFSGRGMAPIPVMVAWLADFDVVYSAHITRYGAVPATLQHAPGTEVAVSVTWLDDRQLVAMHDTEAIGINYDYARLFDIRVSLPGDVVLKEAYAYNSRHGCLCLDGEPVAMAAAAAMRRRWRACDQGQVQALLRDRLSPGENLDTFTLAHTDSADIRRDRTSRLAADAAPFAYANIDVL